MRPISGGLLLQAARPRSTPPATTRPTWTLATGDAGRRRRRWPTWRSPGGPCRAVKSNAILLAARRRHGRRRHGPGQPGRLRRLAVARAGERAAGSVAASDAFFPFADGLQVLLDAGVRAVVQPGGSVRDEEVVAAAAAAGVTLYLTGTRHFSH